LSRSYPISAIAVAAELRDAWLGGYFVSGFLYSRMIT